mmetsp:Transcript_28555/g.43903  ORF Transcript_28555/g.43903 Transcript_28555/m.43903 type:complete len:179 (+) Transcript_28555:190-726(+)|eukprot:CAMPEP_0118684172 /NCGR_PEP_ID=MMETSP0800-20121206/6492_1 /TAXON_ID=210618 ORGANISM="Striatella unipunctata, Strain CCMP2910" /NCGR_SAMPLE_ID=MMETSP0800 /ASSEMBLY_ACC=CAM_ASM_000638 /LENGTH=178 /DNA_ID=CAMNT_0006580841 /DNA_START=138 /DNA_END=674 /DNA_ORIENTATION=+
MVRSLKVIGTLLALSAAPSLSLTVQRKNFVSSAWGISPSTDFARRNICSVPMYQAKQDTTEMMSRDYGSRRESGGPAVLDRPVTEKKTSSVVQEEEKMNSGEWKVRIYNDGMNTREHVALSLVKVTGISETAAYDTMMQAHNHGIAVVGRWIYQTAEEYYKNLKNQGIVCDIIPVEEE